MKKLLRSYLYAIVFLVIGFIVVGIWFQQLLLWFGLASLVSVINYALLLLAHDEKRFSSTTLLLILLLRYLIFGGACFAIIFANRQSDHLVGIAIVLAIGISIMKFATIVNTLVHRNEGVE